jgi:lipoprotein-anchoring transpeptidase ErfK/SrfK
MVYRHIVKVRDGLMKLRHRTGWKWRLGVAATSFFLIVAATWWLALPLPKDYETDVPPYATAYAVSPVSCDCRKAGASRINLRFTSLEPALNAMPKHTIEEIADQAKTVVVFENVSLIDGEFNYDEIVGSPLIDSIDYNVKDGLFVLEINRKGAYLPAEISIQGVLATIVLEPAAQDYPIISNQKPANDSAAFPAIHPISFDAALSSPLKSAAVFLNGARVDFEVIEAGANFYHFSFNQLLMIDTDYAVKAIISDNQGRTIVSTWTFTGQIPSAAILGKDRFKYLGWWGQVNSDGVSVRKGVAVSSDKLGTLSSANRVKVVKEVFGEWVNGKNLWYQIDGGVYPGAYIFSDFVTPMEPPAPPAKFNIPEGVNAGQKWIDVDLTKKILTLFDYDKPVFTTYISPGRTENPTETGTYRVWYKLTKAEMRGGPPLHTYRYDLKNIPWVMYYNYDYAIHGTYWHDKFGMPQSAGCTNMTQGDAKYIFDNTVPRIPEGKKGVFSTDANPGTVVFNHE